jgi:hypothetical protein
MARWPADRRRDGPVFRPPVAGQRLAERSNSVSCVRLGACIEIPQELDPARAPSNSENRSADNDQSSRH